MDYGLLPFVLHAGLTTGLAFACVATDRRRSRMLRLAVDGAVVEGSSVVAVGRWLNSRVGLLNHTVLPVGHGLWFSGTSAVHMRGMLVAIDIVFLDRDGMVLGTEAGVAPGRGRIEGPKKTWTVVELGQGSVEVMGLKPGMRVSPSC